MDFDCKKSKKIIKERCCTSSIIIVTILHIQSEDLNTIFFIIFYCVKSLKEAFPSWAFWCTPVIPATQLQARGWRVRSQPGQLSETLSQNTNK